MGGGWQGREKRREELIGFFNLLIKGMEFIFEGLERGLGCLISFFGGRGRDKKKKRKK